MHITILRLNDLPDEKLNTYIFQIAQWHFSEWGKYRIGSTVELWEKNLLKSIQNGTRIIVAVNSNDILVGSVSLKKENMENMFPEYTPWLSGIFISPEFRLVGISPLLINGLAKLAIIEGYSKLYVFSHDLDLENYYKRFGWSLIRPESGENHYIYKNFPIILLEASAKFVLEKTQQYIEQHNNSQKHSFWKNNHFDRKEEKSEIQDSPRP